MCTKPGKEWCVAQLNADRAKPFILFEITTFPTFRRPFMRSEGSRVGINSKNVIPVDYTLRNRQASMIII